MIRRAQSSGQKKCEWNGSEQLDRRSIAERVKVSDRSAASVPPVFCDDTEGIQRERVQSQARLETLETQLATERWRRTG